MTEETIVLDPTTRRIEMPAWRALTALGKDIEQRVAHISQAMLTPLPGSTTTYDNINAGRWDAAATDASILIRLILAELNEPITDNFATHIEDLATAIDEMFGIIGRFPELANICYEFCALAEAVIEAFYDARVDAEDTAPADGEMSAADLMAAIDRLKAEREKLPPQPPLARSIALIHAKYVFIEMERTALAERRKARLHPYVASAEHRPDA
jgi:hypothetical protein